MRVWQNMASGVAPVPSQLEQLKPALLRNLVLTLLSLQKAAAVEQEATIAEQDVTVVKQNINTIE